MRHPSLTQFLTSTPTVLSKGPVAIVMAEDPVEVASTLRHHLDAGFREALLLTPDAVPLDPEMEARVHRISHDVHAEDAMVNAVNRIIEATPPGVWLFYCFNAEYLFHPFCETRNVRELISFNAEERREAFLTYVIDLYAGDLGQHPNAVALETAHLDRSGYYALARPDPDNHNYPKERQLDFFGGLRWRFEEHIPPLRRKIDRITLFCCKPGLRLRPDFTCTDDEYNTYACKWHNSITTALCSFRTAKALKTNPGSTFGIADYRWHNSTPFQWHSQQLMELGLMEPGQWF